MALHTELDIYKTGYDLFTRVTKIVENMKRPFKHLIGEEIVRETAKLLILVYRANIADDKAPHLSVLIEKVKLVELFLRLSLDDEKISPRQYYGTILLTQSIGKQASGWRKSSSVKRPSHGGQGRHD
ncbi:four helix bundle protein [Trinickia dinghuensis]|uniref:Four helix bundle protein n=1 Tax=Trinickia dinghuensis TaxID=2291023 RepID=A0A3D8K162_9BURK|nr:four helix bundle protein [Trinickia dinghuensis]RDU99173.1 four helix bundle protein [Trinickia dinghuensis]